MALSSGIEWTDATWNPTVGCTKVSPGCKHCYAEVMHSRLERMPGMKKYANPFKVIQPWQDDLELPLSWKKPKNIFVNSMSDLFHDDVPDEYILSCFDVMRRAHWHTFQVLTKRSLRPLHLTLEWPPNVWMGVSIENDHCTFRARNLSDVPAAVRFLSVEPLLGPIDKLPLEGIHWVIVGGESGHKARPMHPDWVRSIRDQCTAQNVPFFFKQWGEYSYNYDRDRDDPDLRQCAEISKLPGRTINLSGGYGFHGERVHYAHRVGKKAAGRILDGRTWDEMPNGVR